MDQRVPGWSDSGHYDGAWSSSISRSGSAGGGWPRAKQEWLLTESYDIGQRASVPKPYLHRYSIEVPPQMGPWSRTGSVSPSLRAKLVLYGHHGTVAETQQKPRWHHLRQREAQGW